MIMEISWHPDDRRLRQFAVLWLLVSSGLLIHWSRAIAGYPSVTVFVAVLAVLIGIVGLFKPQLLRPIYVGWMIAVFPIGWMVSRLVLAILFYGVFTPIGMFFRMLGRDALGLQRQPELASYWVSKETPDDPRRYLQQF
jgi:hypothetical protein